MLNIAKLQKQTKVLLRKLLVRFNALTTAGKIVTIVVGFSVLWMLSGIFSQNGAAKNSVQGKNIDKIYESIQSTAALKPKLLRLNGISTAGLVINLKSETEGLITEVITGSGNPVRKGQEILKLDPRAKEEVKEQAKVSLKQAEIKYDAELALDKKGLSSPARLAAAAANLKQAKATLSAAELDLKRSTIVAPEDGRADKVFPDPGQFIQVGDDVVRFVIAEPYLIVVGIPENHINNVKVGQKVYIESDNGTIFEGTVSFLSGVANNATKTFEAKIILDGRPFNYTSGLSLYVSIQLDEVPAHKIPLSALTLDTEGNVMIKFIENEIVKSAPVKLIAEDDDGIWVSNLPDEAEIVILGASNLIVGDKIR